MKNRKMATAGNKRKLYMIALLMTSIAAILTTSQALAPPIGQVRSTNCRNSNGRRGACRNNDTTERRAAQRRTSLSARGRLIPSNVVESVANSTSAAAIVLVADFDRATFDNATSSQTVEIRRHGNATRPKHRLIRGSKQAATITRKELLKTDWCQTEPFQQIIQEEGCLKSRILNRFCYGQCNSFFIPKSEEPDIVIGNSDRVDAFAPSDYLIGHFRSCAVCTPKVAEWAVVVLRCPSLTPPFRRKRVRIVRQCKCMALKLD